jgi:hypothetical protein
MGPAEIHTLRNFLLFCLAIDYALLIIWVIFIFTTRGLAFPKWFRVSQEDWDRYNLLGIIFFKSGVILFVLVPWIALTIMG